MYKKIIPPVAMLLILPASIIAQGADNIISTKGNSFGLWVFAIAIILPLLFIILKLYFDFKQQVKENDIAKKEGAALKLSQYLKKRI